MNKELTPLEALDITIKAKEYNHDYDILILDDNYGYILNGKSPEIIKKLKALEIIVKKKVNVDTLLHALDVFTETYALSQYNAMYGNEIVINGVKQPNRTLTEEEFDLIKEVVKQYGKR